MGMDLARLLRSGAKGMGVGTALFGTTAAGLWWQLFRRPLPRIVGEFEISGLDDRVEIARDRWGMPAVRAQTAADLWFGQGFCHGQDRLWQIDVQRRICSGRVSEIAGRVGLPADRLMRTLGLRRLALREEAELGSDLRPLLDRASQQLRGLLRGGEPRVARRQQRQSGALPRDQLGCGACAGAGLQRTRFAAHPFQHRLRLQRGRWPRYAVQRNG